MPKWSNDAGIDAALDYYADSDAMTLCSQQPATFAEVTTYRLATVAMSAGDFVKANGTPNGRKVTVAAKTDVPVTATGSATHVVLTKASGSVLKYVTTVDAQTVTSGNTVDIGSWAITISDPV